MNRRPPRSTLPDTLFPYRTLVRSYQPRSGSITFKGRRLPAMGPHFAAANGVARTFQNIALFRGMSTLDNLMTGRGLKMKRGLLWQALYWGPARREEMAQDRQSTRLNSSH